MKAKEWQKIDCEGIDQINCSEIWALENGSSQYITERRWGGFYQFTGNGNNAIVERLSGTYLNYNDKVYFLNETTICDPYYWYEDNFTIMLVTIDQYDLYYYKIENTLFYDNGQFFLMNNNHYFLDYSEGKLYPLTLVYGNDNEGTIEISAPLQLEHTPTEILSIVVLNNKLYYLSGNSVYSVKISNNTLEYELIYSNTGIDETSIFVTDYKQKIWILNSATGVIEYDTKTGEANKIAEFPGNAIREIEFNKACFYYNGYLYYIASNKVYALNLLDVPTPPTPPTPDNPRKPKMPWIGPITPIIEGGHKFTGLAEFFAMHNDSYLSIMCNGMPMIFTFDPIMHSFHLAPQAPHFDPANSHNAFMNDKYFYIYNPDRNTITCTDTRSGMSQEIACYETIPQDIIQVVVANNLFYILTKSGENHIARMAGANLEYVSSWKLDDWTPRTGDSIVALKNAIYVFGGKALSNDSKEEPSNACYNELYVYDLTQKASEKLEVDKDITARHNAKILSSKRWGKLWIIGGKDSTDSLALDIWEFNTRNKEWTYINSIPKKDVNASASYDEKNDSLSLLLTPEENTEQNEFFSMRSNTRSIPQVSMHSNTRSSMRSNTRNISQASMRSNTHNIFQSSSGAVVYQIKDLSTATSTKDQSGKSCGCLGIEFLLALAGLFILRRLYNA